MILDPQHLSVETLLQSPQAKKNLSPDELARLCVETDACRLASNGAVDAFSGRYRGRIPEDKFIIADQETHDRVWWGGNASNTQPNFEKVRAKVVKYLGERPIYIVDTIAGADPAHQIKVRFIVERPYHALFVRQLFIKPTAEQLANFKPDWVVMNASKLLLDNKADGTRTDAAIMLNFTERQICIAGTEYAGEMKKSIFTVMNYLLPQRGIMSMHCSANLGPEGDTALFFGLSGTGKTSLSADPERSLIGDDEHGWSDTGTFNIEGGCYAKCINLRQDKEPEIWNAITAGAILENVVLNAEGIPDYTNQSITENTRAAYPMSHIPHALHPSVGGHPKNIVFLTCDALGLLPPISLLTPAQVISYFLNGYTAKVAGTEAGVQEPTLTFSTCFGKPFMPLNPHVYADLLCEKIERHGSRVWLLNTGWTAGPYGVGYRISIAHTRAMLKAALHGELDAVPYTIHSIFGLQSPTTCPGVPDELLNPKGMWNDPRAYDEKAVYLQGLFDENAAKYGIRP